MWIVCFSTWKPHYIFAYLHISILNVWGLKSFLQHADHIRSHDQNMLNHVLIMWPDVIHLWGISVILHGDVVESSFISHQKLLHAWLYLTESYISLNCSSHWVRGRNTPMTGHQWITGDTHSLSVTPRDVTQLNNEMGHHWPSLGLFFTSRTLMGFSSGSSSLEGSGEGELSLRWSLLRYLPTRPPPPSPRSYLSSIRYRSPGLRPLLWYLWWSELVSRARPRLPSLLVLSGLGDVLSWLRPRLLPGWL